ncbi:hypothetical protein R6Q57_003665 [Mikania cordata]
MSNLVTLMERSVDYFRRQQQLLKHHLLTTLIIFNGSLMMHMFCTILVSTIFESSFQYVNARHLDLWLALEAYAPMNSSREYTFKTKLLKIEM